MCTSRFSSRLKSNTKGRVESLNSATVPDIRTRAQLWVNEGSRSLLRLHTRRLATLRAAGFQRLAGSGGPSVSIALIDGAIDCGHPALRGARIVGGTLAASSSSHATFIASIFAGGGPHSLGICRDCSIVSLPDLTDDFAAGRLL